MTWKDPAEPLRLNRPAKLAGEARYYFGLPVASGSVRWRVTRTPQYFWWSFWSSGNPAARTQTVASGVSALKPDGSFEVAFTPAADERLGKSSKDLTYTYAVDADVSDEGGETRSASRSFRLGFVSVEARLVDPPGFLLASRPGRFRVSRTNLDGTARAGKGSWRIVALEQPARASLPADLPPSGTSRGTVARGRGSAVSSPRIPSGNEFRTPGDALRPRWDTAYDPAAVMRLWKDAKEVSRGEIAHDAQGEALIEVGGLPAGAYRLYYSTVDDFGAVFEMPREFLVASQETPLALPAVLAVESATVTVGGTARFLVTTGLPDQTLFFDVYSAGRRVERRELSDRSPALVEIPVAEKDRGGFSVKLSALRDHQWMTLTQSVFVPWDNKQLKVSFATFRDTLRPGARETWRVRVEGPKGSKGEVRAAELLAYMYDRSLDAFVKHVPADPFALYPNRTGVDWSQPNLAEAWFQFLRESFPALPDYPRLRPDALKSFGGFAIGGPGRRGVLGGVAGVAAGVAGDMMMKTASVEVAASPQALLSGSLMQREGGIPAPAAAIPLRSEFAETAFWQPHLLTGADGSAAIEFTVPDSVTSWNVFVHAVTRDWKAGAIEKQAKSVKDLMVRPYVPRFLREGDAAELKVVVNNASAKPMAGAVAIDILDPDTNASALSAFGVAAEKASLPFAVEAGRGTTFA